MANLILNLPSERPNPLFRVRAVNLGGWLVTEGWIKPSLFDGIPNKDLLDGTSLRFKSVTTDKYLTAKFGGGNVLLANGKGDSDWETFKLWRINEDTFQLRVFNKEFVGLDGINAVAVATDSRHSEEFRIIKESENSSRVRIKARTTGNFLQAKTDEVVIADVSNVNGWGNDDPTVFEMTIVGTIKGEFQVTNGHGPRAQQVMKEHWATFIVEDDFKFIANNGLDAVRIPVGWWIASDPNPPWPYVGGSLHALDNAFKWAEKYGLKIIIDLHAAPGSQNGFDSSSSRDGSLEWGKSYYNLKITVDVISFLTQRYANEPSLYAVELLNEPIFPAVPLETLIMYYRDGYEAVRKHSSTAYVVLSNRLDLSLNELEIPNTRELFPIASGFNRCVIDVHYYSQYYDVFNNMNVQENIDFIYNVRSPQLDYVTSINGPLTFVGEWSGVWKVDGATKEDYQRFAKAQLDVYGRATFGWCYWTFKNVENHWSLEWMIKNGYI